MQVQNEPAHSPYRLIVIASSAGGIEALFMILAEVPADFPLPIVVVQHRPARPVDVLPSLLQRRTKLHVMLLDRDCCEMPRAGTVYVAPADLHAFVDDRGRLCVRDGQRIRYLLSSANPLFESAARTFPGGVIGVVLSGSGTDAAEGVRAIGDSGGVVIAQDPASAKHARMPESAIETGAVSHILRPNLISSVLLRLTGART
jgi:two-component system chemotaxis response regulator CheB